MDFNQEQRTAIFSDKPLVVISAGAGSGKTRVLTERYIHLCELKLASLLKGESSDVAADVQEIVAITFTEKAAREMKERIRKRIIELVSLAEETRHEQQELVINFWKQQKEALDQAHISTIHGFCHQLLHDFSLKAEIPPNFSILDELDATLMKHEIFTELFADSQLMMQSRELFNFYSKSQIQEAIEAVYAKVNELEAGVELRTFFDVNKIIHLQLEQLESDKQLLISHFHKQAVVCVEQFPPVDTLKGAQAKHIVAIEDCFTQLSEDLEPNAYFEKLQKAMPSRGSKAWLESAPSLYELYEQLFKPLKAKWNGFQPIENEDIARLTLLMEQFISLLVRFHEMYEQRKKEQILLDFTDLQQKAIVLLEDEEVQEECRRKYKHMMLDEFQDTNRLQMAMLKLIRPSYRFIVGDSKQSIYRFRGADVRLMKEMETEAKASAATSDFIHMNTNYRTAEKIIHFVNGLFSIVMNGEVGTDYANIDSGRAGLSHDGPSVELLLADEEREDVDEFELLARRMVEIVRSAEPMVEKEGMAVAPSWGDMAVLLQSRTHLPALEKALQEKEIPYNVYGGVGFYERHEVRDFLNLLHWISRPWEPLYLFALLRGPLFGFTFADMYTLQKDRAEVSFDEYIHYEMYKRGSLPEPLQHCLDILNEWQKQWIPFHFHGDLQTGLFKLYEDSGLKTAYLTEENGMQKVKNIEKLIEIIARLRTSSLDESLEQIALIKQFSEQEGEAEIDFADGDAVHIMTVHASKGLEFPIVFLPSMARPRRSDSGNIRFDEQARLVMKYKLEDDRNPLEKAEEKVSPAFPVVKERADIEATEEAKRLFYVATTRARDFLVMVGKNKAPKHSWLSMLETALEENSGLEQFVAIKVDVAEQDIVVRQVRTYEPPRRFIKPKQAISFSVSEVMTFIHDPVRYYEQSILKLPETLQEVGETYEEGNNSKLRAGDLGTYVHRVCELIDHGFTKQEAIDEALFLLDKFEANRYRQEVEILLGDYHEGRSADLGEHIANEWPFVLRIGEAEIIGEIDKIVRDEEGIHLIDFKTNRQRADELLKYYKPQLYLYKTAYEKITSEKVTKLSLYVFRDEKQPLHSVEITHSYEQFLQDKLQEMIQLKQEDAPRSAYENIT